MFEICACRRRSHELPSSYDNRHEIVSPQKRRSDAIPERLDIRVSQICKGAVLFTSAARTLIRIPAVPTEARSADYKPYGNSEFQFADLPVLRRDKPFPLADWRIVRVMRGAGRRRYGRNKTAREEKAKLRRRAGEIAAEPRKCRAYVWLFTPLPSFSFGW